MAASRRPVILVVSGWQTVNIGDIAHTPGLLALLEKYLPEAEVLLWPVKTDPATELMLHRRFSSLRLVADDDVERAFERADVMLHGSGPGLVGRRQIERWHSSTGKPYALFGVTIESTGSGMRRLLRGAALVGCRETQSVANVRRALGQRAQVMFVPDAAFGCDLNDTAATGAYLSAANLQSWFLAVVPRLRFTPYHRIYPGWGTTEEIARRESVNERFAEVDHAKLRQVICRWVRETGRQVLVCPEMTYQTEIIQPLVIDPLPEDVKPAVLGRTDYWLPDLASGVYHCAAAIVSFECHSPILACAAGTPGFYLRQPTDTIKGRMWHDLDLSDWCFEIDEVDGDQIADRVLQVALAMVYAQERVGCALSLAQQRFSAYFNALRGLLPRRGRQAS